MAKATTWVILGGVGLAAMLFGRKASAAGAAAGNTAKLVPAPVNANEEVSAGTYRVINAKRTNPALNYVQATGNIGGTVTFTSPVAGLFTRNVVSDGSGALLAEVAVSAQSAQAGVPQDSAMSGLGWFGRYGGQRTGHRVLRSR